MGVQMMVFTYLLGRTDDQGRNVIEAWSDRKTSDSLQSALLSIAALVVVGNVM